MNQPLPIIVINRCSGCGLCVKYCPVHALEVVNHRPVFVLPVACNYCGLCEEYCPELAVELVYWIRSKP